MKIIDLNADIGEGFEWDVQLLNIISSANVCTGVYAGSSDLTQKVTRMAREKGVRVGAHFGFPDRDSMGRRELQEGIPDSWAESLVEQITNAKDASYLKPHGAAYHWLAQQDNAQTAKVWNAIEDSQKPFLGLPNSRHEAECSKRRIQFYSEGFCERGYDPLGGLIPRNQPGAELGNINAIVKQAIKLSKKVDSICIHGDRPDCVEIALTVKTALLSAGLEVRN